MWVEADLEWPGHGRDPAAELFLGILEALGDVVDWLVFLVLVGLDGGAGRVKSAVLGLVADGVQQFSVGRQQTGTVGLDFVVFLAQTELYGEPVDLRNRENIKPISITEVITIRPIPATVNRHLAKKQRSTESKFRHNCSHPSSRMYGSYTVQLLRVRPVNRPRPAPNARLTY